VAFRLPVAERRTRNGILFPPSNIQRMLSNPAYRGNCRFIRKGLKGKIKNSLSGPDSEGMTFTGPSIIDEATWEKAHLEMVARTGHKTALVPFSDFWLRNSLTCGLCGCRIVPRQSLLTCKDDTCPLR